MERYATFIIFFLFLFLTNITAQTNILTLKNALSAPAADSCTLFYELGKHYEEVNIDSCFYFLQASLALAQRNKNASATAQAMNRIGFNYTTRVRNDGKAVEWLNKAITVAKPMQDNLNLARSYQYLGLIAHWQNSNHADELLARALTHAKAANDWEVLVNTYDIMATRFSKLKKFKEAEMALLNALDACEQHDPDSWLSYGLDYVEQLIVQDRKEEAYMFCLKLADVKAKLKKTKGEFVYFMDLGRLESKLKHFASADSIFQHALSIEKVKAVPDTFHLTIIYRLLLELNILRGDTEKTYQTIEYLTDLRLAAKEGRLTQDSKVKMTELKSTLDLEKKEAEIALMDVQKNNQRLLLIGAIMLTVLLIGFIAILQRNKRHIEEQKTELSEINATKDKLFSIIAHDLRTPIGTLKTYLDLTDFGLMSQAEFSTASQKLTDNISALFQTLDNLLHWSFTQLKGIKAEPKNINLRELVSEELLFLQETAQQKNIAILNNIPLEITVFADPNQIGLAIRNIVSNALKFTHSDGEIVLNCKNTVEEHNSDGSEKGGKITLEISDNGIGMPQDIQNHLFNINEKASRRGTASEKGQGLGLILAKEMVEANGGTLQIESVENQGTTVRLAMNLKTPQ